MGEVVGQIETIEPKEKGGCKLSLKTNEGSTRTLHIASNYEGKQPATGDWGKFRFKEWKPDGWGEDRSAMKMVDSWEEVSEPAVNGAAPISNGSHPTSTLPGSSSTPRSAVEITATEILGQAKDIICRLVEIGAIKEITDADTYWLQLAEDAMTWHAQKTR